MRAPKTVGKYEIAEQIGMGGFGVVYKAWDPYIRRWVALKTCASSDDEGTQRFFREAQLAGALQHPNITLIFDFGIEDGTPYVVQEFLSGTDLDEILGRRQLRLEGIIAILLQVSAGLDFAHSRGIIHRDIKPANVRLLEDGTVKIMDFGIAKSLQTESRLTQTGVALGTAGYLAPEQLAGKPLDARTDLFSLGVMAYEMVTGVRPFAGPNLSNVIYQILNQAPVAPHDRNRDCPERLERTILRALAKEPERRFPGVREFAQDLKLVLSELPPAPSGRRLDTTTAIVREELALVTRQPRADLTAPTQLAARPLEHLPTAPATQAGTTRHGAALRWFPVAGVVLLAAALGTWIVGRSHGKTPSADSLLANTRTPAALPSPVPTPAPPTPIPTAAPLTVRLTAYPPAEIDVDGVPLGLVSTKELQLTPGEHRFRQRIAGYREQTSVATIDASRTEVALRLPPYGNLSVFNDFGVPVRGTVVALDGRDIGSLPIQEKKVSAGEHTLVVRWNDGREARQEIVVPPLGSLRVTVTLPQ
jgi:serine/threonine-protein kinase